VGRNIRLQLTCPESGSPRRFFLLPKQLGHGVVVVLLTVAAQFTEAVASEQHKVSPGRVQAADYFFADAISSDYGWGRSLRGWEATSLAVQATLAEWQSPLQLKPALTVRDPSPVGLKQFLAQLPRADIGKTQVIYLAAQHTQRGDWQFTGNVNADITWNDLLQSTPPLPPFRVVILDICHAAVVATLPVWTEKMAAATTLLASGSDEYTWELDFSNRQPVDLPAQFPAATAWLKRHLPVTWDGRLSYLGLIWVQAFLQTSHPPQTTDDWQAFFRRCILESLRFQEEASRQRASTVSQFPAVP